MTPAQIRKHAIKAAMLIATRRGLKGHKRRTFVRAVALATVLKVKT